MAFFLHRFFKGHWWLAFCADFSSAYRRLQKVALPPPPAAKTIEDSWEGRVILWNTSQQSGRQETPREHKCQTVPDPVAWFNPCTESAARRPFRARGAQCSRCSPIQATSPEWGSADGGAEEALEAKCGSYHQGNLLQPQAFILWKLIFGEHGLPKILAKFEMFLQSFESLWRYRLWFSSGSIGENCLPFQNTTQNLPGVALERVFPDEEEKFTSGLICALIRLCLSSLLLPHSPSPPLVSEKSHHLMISN